MSNDNAPATVVTCKACGGWLMLASTADMTDESKKEFGQMVFEGHGVVQVTAKEAREFKDCECQGNGMTGDLFSQGAKA